MTYEHAVRWLFTAGQELRGVKFDLVNVARLLEELGHPERAWPAVLVAGTNGKGSTAAMLESVLRAAGVRTGLYTSPHLVRVNERIRVAGCEISDSEFAVVASAVSAAIERLLALGALPHHPSFFECLTAIGFEHFHRAAVELAVLEVGMGGRLDATNAVTPLVSVITPIGFDHEAYLGRTMEQIAFEKAGIIRQGGVVVTAPQRPEATAVIERVAEERGARVRSVTNAECGMRSAEWKVALGGQHQRMNAAVAVAVVDELGAQGWAIADEAVREGLATVCWPGRLEWLEGCPALLLDGAHNPLGARALRVYVEEELQGRRMVLLFGAMRDKAVGEIAEILFPLAAAVVLTKPNQRRAATAEALAELTSHLHPCAELHTDPREALGAAGRLAGPDGVVLVTGSLYLVGEVKAILEPVPCAG